MAFFKRSALLLVLVLFVSSYVGAQVTDTVDAVAEAAKNATAHVQADCSDIRIKLTNTGEYNGQAYLFKWKIDVFNACPASGGFRCVPANMVLSCSEFTVFVTDNEVTGDLELIEYTRDNKRFSVLKGGPLNPQQTATGYYIQNHGPAYDTWKVESFNLRCDGV